MPVEPLRRSSRLLQRRKETQAANDNTLETTKADSKDYLSGRSVRIAEQRRENTRPIKRKALKEYQGPEHRRELYKRHKSLSVEPSHSRIQQPTSVKPTETAIAATASHVQEVQNSHKRPQKDDHKQPRRSARLSQPLLAQQAPRQPIVSRLSRAALRQLQSDTADDPLPEGIREVNLPLPIVLSRAHMSCSTSQF
jgi:hypothetical protein